MKKAFYFKIVGAMVISFILSHVFIKEIFIGFSPRIRPNLPDYLAKKISTPLLFLSSVVSDGIRSITKKNTNVSSLEGSPQVLVQSLQDLPFNTIQKGVYGKEDGQITYILIKEKEVNWQEYNVSINGKNIKILVPKGEEQPSEKYLEGL